MMCENLKTRNKRKKVRTKRSVHSYMQYVQLSIKKQSRNQFHHQDSKFFSLSQLTIRSSEQYVKGLLICTCQKNKFNFNKIKMNQSSGIGTKVQTKKKMNLFILRITESSKQVQLVLTDHCSINKMPFVSSRMNYQVEQIQTWCLRTKFIILSAYSILFIMKFSPNDTFHFIREYNWKAIACKLRFKA